jgi:hypothetical protein
LTVSLLVLNGRFIRLWYADVPFGVSEAGVDGKLPCLSLRAKGAQLGRIGAVAAKEFWGLVRQPPVLRGLPVPLGQMGGVARAVSYLLLWGCS